MRLWCAVPMPYVCPPSSFARTRTQAPEDSPQDWTQAPPRHHALIALKPSARARLPARLLLSVLTRSKSRLLPMAVLALVQQTASLLKTFVHSGPGATPGRKGTSRRMLLQRSPTAFLSPFLRKVKVLRCRRVERTCFSSSEKSRLIAAQ